MIDKFIEIIQVVFDSEKEQKLIAVLPEYSVEDLNSQDDTSDTLFIYACRNGFHLLVEQLILKKVDINLQNKSGLSALSASVITGNLKIAEQLIDIGIDVNLKDTSGESVLSYVAQDHDKPDLIEKLIKAGANINHVTPVGNSALHLACANNMFDNIKMLVKYGANINLKNNNNITPFYFSISEKKMEIIDFLFSAQSPQEIVEEFKFLSDFLDKEEALLTQPFLNKAKLYIGLTDELEDNSNKTTKLKL